MDDMGPIYLKDLKISGGPDFGHDLTSHLDLSLRFGLARTRLIYEKLNALEEYIYHVTNKVYCLKLNFPER